MSWSCEFRSDSSRFCSSFSVFLINKMFLIKYKILSKMNSSSSLRSCHSLLMTSFIRAHSTVINTSSANDSLASRSRLSISMKMLYWILSSGTFCSNELSADWVRLTKRRRDKSNSSVSFLGFIVFKSGMRSLLIVSLLSSSRRIVFSVGSSRLRYFIRSLAASRFSFW